MIISFGYITKLKEERLHKSVYGYVDLAQPNPINFSLFVYLNWHQQIGEGIFIYF